jgi:hypothetical protein
LSALGGAWWLLVEKEIRRTMLALASGWARAAGVVGARRRPGTDFLNPIG